MALRRALYFTLAVASLATLAPACKKKGGPGDAAAASTGDEDPAAADPAPNLTAKADAPRIASISMETKIFERPDPKSRVLGYFRVGQTLPRSDQPVSGCWYQVAPRGYVCAGEPGPPQGNATLDLNHPIIRAVGIKPDLTKPMPYIYGFVRRDATLWHQVPNQPMMDRWEFAWDGWVREYKKHHHSMNKVDKADPNTVPLDAEGNPKMLPKDVPPIAPPLDEDHLFPDIEGGQIPWWLVWEGSHARRRIPNLSTYIAAEDFVRRGKVYRHAGLAVIGSFKTEKRSSFRKFTVLLDGRLIAEDKIKPHYASSFHGTAVGCDGCPQFPFAIVRKRKDTHYYGKEGYKPIGGPLTFRDIIPLTGKSQLRAPKFYFETKQEGKWVREDEVAAFIPPPPPKSFDWKHTKWIDVSITYQLLTLYDGEKPVYATLVSTGVDGAQDPYTTKSTIQGEFRIDFKHITVTMDADDPENHFELRDVPWVQYFEGGFALHAAYWHDDFGTPRSHGCVNMAPVDARRVFFWTDPPLPEAWHAVKSGNSMGQGTWVRVRP